MIKFFDEHNLPYSLHYDNMNLLDITFYNNSVILDMFDVISYICYKDFYTKRDEDVNNRDKLSIEIPVENYEKFKVCKEKIEYLINYMTNGENWNINFKQCSTKKEIISDRLNLEPTIKYNSISLLSGGLDALSGTISEESNKTIYVTFGTNFIEASNAHKIYNKIIDKSKNAHVYVKKVLMDEEQHYTERTRSLMFIGCCLIFADFYQIKKINIYENGIMSLNPKFNFSRRVTKTTNQKTIYLINEILSTLGINIEVENPFRYMTKAQVISQIPEKYFEIVSNETRTCSKNSGIIHFSNKTKGNFHCGLCIACLLRQIGTINNNLLDYDDNYLLPSNLYIFDDILKYESAISKSGNLSKDYEKARYKYLEKRSLIEYYKTYYRYIKSGRIFNYIELSEKYYKDKDYYNKINEMLKCFSIELEKYFENLKK